MLKDWLKSHKSRLQRNTTVLHVLYGAYATGLVRHYTHTYVVFRSYQYYRSNLAHSEIIPVCRPTVFKMNAVECIFGEIFVLSSGAVEAHFRPRRVVAPLSDWLQKFPESLMAVSSRTGMFVQNFFTQ